MADAGDPIDTSDATEALNDLRNQTNSLKSASGDLLDTSRAYNKAAEILANIEGLPAGQLAQYQRGIEQGSIAQQKLNKDINSTNAAQSVFGVSVEGAVKKASGALTWMGKQFDKIMGNMDNQTKDFAKSLATGFDSAGALMMAKGYSTLIDKVDSATGAISDIQKPMLDTRRTALQVGLGFGQGFEKASTSVDAFHKSMAESQVNTRALREEMISVQSALREAFKPDEMNANLESLGSANKKFQSALNNTNAALLVAKAKGMDAAETAGMLAEAHLVLGESAESAPKIFAQISQAADNSGLQYRKVSEAIMRSAGDLKMWGGTVGSVTPVFQAFSRSLADGQKGLAPELVQQYISGLQGMKFEMRAMIGLRAPGAAGVTAIGAGLRQEALMEKGEAGMGELSKNLIDTLKGFTGGRMLTREEAIESPALESQFLQQRELLKQMIGGSDANANKMIEALKEVDEGGLEVGKDQAKRLNEIMKSGEDVAKTTTDAQTDAMIGLQSTVQSQGNKMLTVVDKILNRMPGVRKAREQLRGMARGEKGAVGALGDFSKDIGAGGMFNKVVDKIHKMTGKSTSTESERKEIKIGQTAGMESVTNAFNKIANIREATINKQDGGFKNINEKARTRIATGRDIQTKNVMPELKSVLRDLNTEIKTLVNKVKTGKASREETSQLMTMREGRNRLRHAAQQKRINLSDFGTATGDMNERTQDDKSRRDDYAVKAYKQWQDRQKTAMNSGITRVKMQMPMDQPTLPLGGDAIVGASARRKNVLPIKEAQAATRESQKQRIELDFGDGAIEKEVRFKLISDKSSVTVELEDEILEDKIVAVFKNHKDM